MCIFGVWDSTHQLRITIRSTTSSLQTGGYRAQFRTLDFCKRMLRRMEKSFHHLIESPAYCNHHCWGFSGVVQDPYIAPITPDITVVSIFFSIASMVPVWKHQSECWAELLPSKDLTFVYGGFPKLGVPIWGSP